MEKIIAYKGMDNNMQCRGYQYEVGKEYEHDGNVETCSKGFHACEYPLDVLGYYNPADSRFFEVEQYGRIDKSGDKTASSELKINAEIGIVGIVKAAIGYTFSRAKKTGKNTASGDHSASQASGDRSASQASGDHSASQASGDQSASQASGDRSASQASGYQSASQASGDQSASQASGDQSASQVTGCFSSTKTNGKYSIATAWGYQSRAMVSDENSYMVLSDWRIDKECNRYLHGAHLVKVGDKLKSKTIRTNTWYWFEGGKLKSKKVK
jgi:hypothetical protein